MTRLDKTLAPGRKAGDPVRLKRTARPHHNPHYPTGNVLELGRDRYKVRWPDGNETEHAENELIFI